MPVLFQYLKCHLQSGIPLGLSNRQVEDLCKSPHPKQEYIIRDIVTYTDNQIYFKWDNVLIPV